MTGSAKSVTPREVRSRTVRWLGSAAALAAVFLFVLVVPAQGQAVVGRTVAASTDAPLAGVFITLTDGSGQQAAGFLSRSDGGFLIRAPSTGTYVLRAEMIGYRSVEQTVDLNANETVRETLRLPLEAIRLEGIVARGTRQRKCALRANEGDALSRLWSEARKGLRIADWAENDGWLRANGYSYQRLLELVELEVLAESVLPARSLERNAFVAADPDSLRAQGFILTSGGGSVYRGADAKLLLSDAFMETHCFDLQKRESEGLVGIGFEPIPGRDMPDIEGVLWLDSETGRLKRLEYQYTRYPVNFPLPKSRFGGQTEFRHLPGGGVAVEQWWIRMPTLNQWADAAALRSVRRCGMAACDDRETLRKLSAAGLTIEEEGGQVLSFRLADGTRLPAAERAAMTGVVLDSTVAGSPVPLSGAEVIVQGTENRAVTDARGRFRLDHLAEGTYRLLFHHPRLAELGIERPSAVLGRAREGEVVTVTLATPSWSTLASAQCEAAIAGDDSDRRNRAPAPGAILHGVVRDAATDAPIGGAKVRLEHRSVASAEKAEARVAPLEEETDPAGRYLFCNVPAYPVRLTASYLGKSGDEVRAVLRQDRPTRVDLDLILSTSARVLGRVVRANDEAGVGGVLVRIQETDQTAVTDEAGRFAFDSVSPGGLSLTTEHIAYRPSEGALAVSGGEVVRVELRVAEEVFDLDPLVVTARSRPLLMPERMRGFYVRQARGMGQFIGRDLLDDRPAAHVTDLLREVSAISVTFTGHGRILQSKRNVGGASGSNPFCSPVLYLDGTRLTNRMGAPPPGETAPDSSPLEDAVRIIDSIPSSEIAGIEIYGGAASIPGEFAGLDTQCGVIAVWTRVSDQSRDTR